MVASIYSKVKQWKYFFRLNIFLLTVLALLSEMSIKTWSVSLEKWSKQQNKLLVLGFIIVMHIYFHPEFCGRGFTLSVQICRDINMHTVTISKTCPSLDFRKFKLKGFISSSQWSHDSPKWKQMWHTRFPCGTSTMWALMNTEKCKYALYPHHKHSHADSHNTLPCTPFFSSACPHLPPAASRVNVAGVA